MPEDQHFHRMEIKLSDVQDLKKAVVNRNKTKHSVITPSSSQDTEQLDWGRGGSRGGERGMDQT